MHSWPIKMFILNKSINKMKRKYGLSPTAYHKNSGPTQFLKTQFSPVVFSNLLSNIDKNNQSSTKSNRISIIQPHRGSYCKIKPYELNLKQSDIKMLDISQFMSNRRNKERDQARYVTQPRTANNSRTLLKKYAVQKLDPENKSFAELSPKILSGTCQVTPIKITRRPSTSRQRSVIHIDLIDNLQSDKMKCTKIQPKQQEKSQIINFPMHNQDIEPWAFRNNQKSFVCYLFIDRIVKNQTSNSQ